MSFPLVLRLSCAFVLAAPALAQTPGSVFVLNRVGGHVEGNAYARKDAVYLSGGPGTSCFAAGLADGDYCFQLTDPAGTVLLTPDAIVDRSVRVINGRMSAYLGTSRPAANVGPCGALNVRLAPFVTTPYPSGEYKIWFTRIADYDPNGSQLFGFDPARSKSDNFRVSAVGPQAIVSGTTYYDHDESGVWNPAVDPLEVAIGGWRVDLLRDGVLDGTTFTDQDGRYLFVRDRDASSWEVREQSPNGFVNDGTPGATWLATTALSGVVVTTAEYVPGPVFGNVRYELVPSAGRSVEFWSQNGPGRDMLLASDPLWRSALNSYDGLPVNLRRPVSNDNPNASIFTVRPPPHAFNGVWANWKSYVQKEPHDHAGFLLSRQVAATLLNNAVGFMQGDILVDRFQDGVLVSLDTMLTGAIGLLSETGAGSTGPNDPYQDLRMRMIMCTNEFGSINNTGDPAAPQVVFTRSREAGMIAAPY